MVPHPARRDRSRPLPARARLRLGLGATPVAVDPQAHDRLVALTSHLPHALANLLVNQAGATRIEGHEPLAAAGGSLRDMTRVAGANPRIWVDIFLENAAALARVARGAPAADRAARSRARRRATQASSRAGSARRPATAGGCSPTPIPTRATLQRLRVHVPDRPGVLAGITQALGAERINIEDFELQHVSPERGGDADAARRRRGGGRAGARRCSRRRVTASSSRRCSRTMRIEPAVVARGAHRRAGRQVDLAPRACCSARSARARRGSAASAASADTESTIAAVRALGVEVDDEDVDTLRVAGAGCAGCASPRGRSTAATPARCSGCSPGCSPARRASSCSPATSRFGAGPRSGSPSRSGDGRARRDDRRHAAGARSRARALHGDPLRAAGRERAGEVGRPARRALGRRRRDDRRSSRCHARPHREDARGRRRAASGGGPARLGLRRSSACARDGRRCPATSPRPRRSSSRRRCSPARSSGPRRGRQPDAHRAPGRARADGRADHDLRPAARSAASRSPTSRCSSAPLIATTVRAEEVPRLIDELPLFALAAAWPAARASSAAPRSCA